MDGTNGSKLQLRVVTPSFVCLWYMMEGFLRAYKL